MKRLGGIYDLGNQGQVVAYNLASYAGAWLGGAGTGYVIGKSGKDAVTGGLTTSGVWSVATGLAGANTNNGVLTAAYLGFGTLSIYLAWKR